MYQDFYKFSGNPFELSPDPRFFFASRGHSRAFAYLKYGVYQGDGFIVITGDVGAGKTTLARSMLGELDSEKIVAAELVNTSLDDEDIVHAVASAFGLPIQDLGKAEMLARFEGFLHSLGATHRRALLVVDEAQNLTPRAIEELRMLSNFQLGARPLLQTFLIGQPALRDLLRMPSMTQMRQRIIASYHLGPMDRGETRAYVLHRLECVDWKDDPKFDEAIFDRFYEATGGLPRRINAVCTRLLLGASIAGKHVIGSAELTETINEMRDEIGPESHAAAPTVASETLGTVRPFLSTALVARLERIEKGVSAAIELLDQIAHGEAKPAPPAAGARPRFGTRSGGRS